MKLGFKGWIYEDGTIINEKDIVDLDRDIIIYSLYSVVGGENPTKNVDEIIIIFDSNGGVSHKRERIQKRIRLLKNYQ